MLTKQPTKPPETDMFSLNGVFLDVMGYGVLIYGPSGIGKSELALALIQRGHRLIADDVAWFTQKDASTLMGRCPELLQDFLEVRGLGVLNVREMFGDAALCDQSRLDLMIELQYFDDLDPQQLNRIHGVTDHHRLLGQSIPHVLIPVAPARNLGLLVEAAVRNQRLKNHGYDASHAFAERQAKVLAARSPNGR